LLLELELELELELLLELLLELELELLLELLLEFELWFERELLLWFELELLLWFELEFELELELWFELALDRRDWARRPLIVRRLPTARARHHVIGFPSIFRWTVTTRTGADAFCAAAGTFAGVRAPLRYVGDAVAWSFCDRAERGSRAEPTARPTAPSAPA
jgi:hypothetical protein